MPIKHASADAPPQTTPPDIACCHRSALSPMSPGVRTREPLGYFTRRLFQRAERARCRDVAGAIIRLSARARGSPRHAAAQI